MSRRRRHLLGAALIALSIAASGCGAADSQNKPRPAPPIEVTASVDDQAVTVSPSHFGAGLVNLTISNQSHDTVSLAIEGENVSTKSDPIQPNSVGNFKLDFEQGSYDVSGGPDSHAKATSVTVGPPRPSGQNQLLLP